MEAFLRDHRFLLTSPNAYNSLAFGTTQLYNQTVVYNHKRHGQFELGGGRVFEYEKLIKQEIERLKESNPSYWNFSEWYHPTLERTPWYAEIYGKKA